MNSSLSNDSLCVTTRLNSFCLLCSASNRSISIIFMREWISRSLQLSTGSSCPDVLLLLLLLNGTSIAIMLFLPLRALLMLLMLLLLLRLMAVYTHNYTDNGSKRRVNTYKASRWITKSRTLLGSNVVSIKSRMQKRCVGISKGGSCRSPKDTALDAVEQSCE